MGTYRNRRLSAVQGLIFPVLIKTTTNWRLRMTKPSKLVRSVTATAFSLAFIAACWAGIYVFYGKYEISATVDGDGVATPVMVDSEFKCNTPCHFRLPPGSHVIEVQRPEGFDIEHGGALFEMNKLIVFSMGRGMDFSPGFSSGRK
jgi:hypothetical protein